MDQKLKRTMFFGICVCLAALFLNCYMGYRNTQQLYESQHWISHTHEVIEAMDRVLWDVKNAESAARGYIINNTELYQTSFDEAIRTVDSRIDLVEKLTKDNPTQQSNFAPLRAQVKERIDYLKQGMKVRRDEGIEGIQRLNEKLKNKGQFSMNSLVDLVESMKDEENRLMGLRSIDYANNYKFSVTSTVLALVVGMGVILAFAFLLEYHIKAELQSVSRLYQQKELFRITLSSIGDAVITADTKGRVTFLNGVAQKLTGWTQTQAADQPLENVFNIINEETRKTVENPAMKALREGLIVGLANHTILIAKDGIEHHIDDSAAPIRDDRNEIQGTVLVFRDISDRRKAEEVMREADTRKDEFMAMLAHELRNPLAPISNSLNAMNQPGHTDQSRAKLHGIMTRQLQQMVRLVDDLLDISRIHRNKLDLRREITPVNSIVFSAVETCEPVLKASNHKLQVSLPPTPIYVDVDKVRLSQALGNLLNNAAKYTAPGGEIFLQAKVENGEVVLSVRDTGMGIPPEMLSKIFEMFVQVDRSLHRSQGGLGIGLTLVKRIIDMHGGKIEAQSKGLGQGSEFIIHLPQASPPTPLPGPAIPAAPVASKMRILVADDNQDSAETMSMLFGLDGNEVVTASNGLEALTKAESFQPEIVLLDIGMPEMDGYEAARRIRATAWGQKMFLIALTGWGKDEDKEKAKAAGFDIHMVKPVDYDKLKEVLTKRK